MFSKTNTNEKHIELRKARKPGGGGGGRCGI